MTVSGELDDTVPQALLEPLPTDGITALSYVNDSEKSLLASTSWDGGLFVHDTQQRTCVVQHHHRPIDCSSNAASATGGAVPLMSLAVLPNPLQQSLATGALDGSIRLLDVPTNTCRLVGRQGQESGGSSNPSAACCSALGAVQLDTASASPLLASTGWNGQLLLWDLRTSGSESRPISTLKLPGKAFDMHVNPAAPHECVVATSGRRLVTIDVRKAVEQPGSTEDALSDRESPLKYPTRTVRLSRDGSAMAIGSIEGRVAIDYLKPSSDGKKKKDFAFKCHRVKDMVYPVNSIAWHPIVTSTFVTGGCDGSVVLWDSLHKKKLTTIQPPPSPATTTNPNAFPTSIAALALNAEGTELAIASSYTFEQGEQASRPKDEIYIRPLHESEYQPKQQH